MATTTGIILPLQIRASSSAPNHHRRKPPPPPPSSSSSSSSSAASVSSNNHNNNWWTPLFGWSSDPDYITNDSDNLNEEKTVKSEKRVRSGRYAPGCFTEEKARRMRIMMLDVQEAHHDVMYHSAIASRLASDFSDHR